MTGVQQEAQPQAEVLRARVRATWTAGDFGRIAVGYEEGAAAFIERLGLKPGDQMLDVACGTGNLALPAARAGARVTGIDIAPALVVQLAARAAAEGLTLEAREGDAEALPFADDSFDTVVTMFGAMFAAHPQQAANELLRVTRPGGRIAMANWTPEGFVGRMLKLTVGYVPPPAGVPSALLWGNARTVEERIGAGLSDLRFERRAMVLAYPFGPEETVELFRTWYGPTVRAFAALEEERQRKFFDDLVRLWTEHNTAGPNGTRVESEFLAVVGTRA
ncbi:MAG TPA: class I SAM-dependent methyltransferase [Gemmatimonadales bacterium]|jgi:SAM-dependent methyltransferase|nr:class I SAM-dependent methyltransferase [Gemmatimonadales bacterium]